MLPGGADAGVGTATRPSVRGMGGRGVGGGILWGGSRTDDALADGGFLVRLSSERGWGGVADVKPRRVTWIQSGW
jgi:hypothetical protein